MPFETVVLSIAIFLASLVPAVMWWRSDAAERPRFPLAGFTGLFYGVFFGLSALLSPLLPRGADGAIMYYDTPFPDGVSMEAQFLVLGGLAAAWLAYALARHVLAPGMPAFRVPESIDTRWALVLLWFLVAGHALYLTSTTVSSLPSIGPFLMPAILVALIGFWEYRRTERMGKRHFLIAIMTILALVVLGFFESTAITPAIIFMVIFWSLLIGQRPRLALTLLVIAIILFPIAYTANIGAREFMYRWNATGTMTERTQALAVATALRLRVLSCSIGFGSETSCRTDEGKELKRSTSDDRFFATRLGHIFLMERVVGETPDNVPWANGATYTRLLTNLVPRALWPDKPRENLGNQFGREYGLLSSIENEMSLNFPWNVEMYANFGAAGAIVGMAIVGALLALLEMFFLAPRIVGASYAVGLAIAGPLFFQESNTSLMLGNVPAVILTMWFYFFIGAAATPWLTKIRS